MKKTLFAMLLAFACALSSKSQTKGTNAIGLGGGTYTQRMDTNSENGSSESNFKTSSINLNYGHFVKDNFKVGTFVGYSYGNGTSDYYGQQSKSKSRGHFVGLSIDKYYRLLEKFYATVGSGLAYNYFKSDASKLYNASINANAGLSYFVGKRWVVETNLLSAGASFMKQTSSQNIDSKTTSNSFSLSSTGKLTDLGFNIRFLF